MPIYINPEINEFCLIDYRFYDPEGDSKSKLDQIEEMLEGVVYSKQLSFQAVLMNNWYATKALMLKIESFEKLYDCPLKSNRLVDDSAAVLPKRRLDLLDWTEAEQREAKRIKLRGFPKDHKVQLFRVAVSTHRTDYVMTNLKAHTRTQAAKEICALRWKIEQLHREVKQLTGLEHCQCRKARIQRSHIACSFLVKIRFTQLARQSKQTLYQLKHALLDDYLTQKFKNPSLKMTLA